MLKIDIEKALSLPTCRQTLDDGEGGYCAWGGAIIAIEGASFKQYAYFPDAEQVFPLEVGKAAEEAWRLGRKKRIDPLEMNDRSHNEADRQKARRLAVQLLLETGLVEPMDKDLELSRELMKEKISV